MSAYDPHPVHEDPSRSDVKRAAAATAILISLFALFAFAPPHDRTKVVAGIPCSVLSEEDVSTVLGTPMRLMPSTGSVCQYVSTGSGAARALFVTARYDTPASASSAHDIFSVSEVGNAPVQHGGAVAVREGSRSYTFDVVPQSSNDAQAGDEELRLAKMMHRPIIAQQHR